MRLFLTFIRISKLNLLSRSGSSRVLWGLLPVSGTLTQKNPHLTKCNYSIPCPGTYIETQLSQKLAQCNFQALTLEQQMDGEVLLLPIYQSWHNQDHVHQHSSPCDEHGEKQNKTKQERMNHQDRAKKMVTILHNMPQTLMFSLYMSEKSPCF